MNYYPGIDMKQFKGFAVRNETGRNLACILTSDAHQPRELILKNGEVAYPLVADVARIQDPRYLMTADEGLAWYLETVAGELRELRDLLKPVLTEASWITICSHLDRARINLSSISRKLKEKDREGT